MAKKNATKTATGEPGVNKTEEIKKALAATPDKTPKEIADELTARGLEISPGYVSTIKTNMKKAGAAKGKAGRKKVGRKKRAAAGATAASTGTGTRTGITYEQLRMAKDLAQQFGSVDEAKEALNALSQLRE